MGHQHLLRRRTLSGFLTMALAASLMTTIVAISPKAATPTIFVSGMELRTVMQDTNNDGVGDTPTIQGLVSLAVQGGQSAIGTTPVDVDKLVTTDVTLEYNPLYLRPSDWDTNEPCTEGTSSSPTDHMFFHTDEDLYWTEENGVRTPADPFVWDQSTSAVFAKESATMALHLTMDKVTPNKDQGGLIGEVKNNRGQVLGQYIDLTKQDKVELGTLSFYVERDQVANIIKLFDGTPGTLLDPKDHLICLASGNESYSMTSYVHIEGAYQSWQGMDFDPDRVDCSLHFEFEDAILDAEAVRKKVTVNSYEAYTDGQVSDLARTLQNYADTLRVTHASGKQEDVSMRWGEPRGGGMEFTTQGETYRFIWDDAAPLGYTLEKKVDEDTYVLGTYAGDGVYNFTLPGGAAAEFVYNRKQGKYTVEQMYAYEENDPLLPGKPVLKIHPIPMEVTLEVTPVRLEGLEVDNETLTFRNKIKEIGYTYASLNLSQEARLRLNATPEETGVVTPIAGVTPTMPITWTPNAISDVQEKVGGTTVIRHWPLSDSDVTARTGLHIPDDPNIHSADYLFTTLVTNAAIEAKYPWLTIPKAQYDLTSTRRIVDEDASVPPLTTADFELRAEPVDADGNLVIQIARRDPDTEGGYLDIGTYDVIDLYQPDGTYIDPTWFTGAGGVSAGASYTVQPGVTFPWAGGKQGYHITIGTGDRAATDVDADSRKSLQRQINLGGWFGAELATAAGEPKTDRITGYSRPRQNIYTASYTADHDGYTPTEGGSPKRYFDFAGTRAGLLRVYNNTELSTLVTLPDLYTGETPEETETAEEYWIRTRYDATTGAEPGYMRQFKVDSWAHGTEAAGVRTYGIDPFAQNYIYSGGSLVENPNGEEVMVKLSRQEVEAPTTDLDISLTYEQTGDTIQYHGDSNEVKRVKFDAKNEGYTWQQVVTLTITNTGTEELHGLYIDGLEDFRYKNSGDENDTAVPSGSCFTILSQPAPNLAVGASTTFQISYVPDLKVRSSDKEIEETWYEDVTLHVRNDAGTIDRVFEADLKITRKDSYQVDLIVRPDPSIPTVSMGDAHFVSGVDTITNIYDPAPVGAAYQPGSTVWVLTQPEDEYALIPKAPYYLSTEQETLLNEPSLQKDGSPVLDPGSGKPLYKNYLTEYGAQNLADGSPSYDTLAGERLYFFTMPEKSVTVYVDYFEPLRSKLRLHDLLAYAWDNGDWANDPGEDPNDHWIPANQRPLHEVDGENRDVTLFNPSTGTYEVLPVEIPEGTTNGSYRETLFDPQKSEYVVFLEDSDRSCGVSVQLRQLERLMNALEINEDIKPTIVMTLDDAAHTEIYNEVGGTADLNDPTNPEDVNYIHRSMLFAAPEEPGSSKTVTIAVTYNDSSDDYWTGSEGLVTRTYTVRFMRRPESNKKGLHTANAGNSPYGMIMNDDAITQKVEAKEAFDRNNRFNFDDNDGLTPVKAYTDDDKTAHKLTNIYWPEAWGSGTNYDKEETALFVYIGEPFDEPGVTNIVNTAGELVTTNDLTITLTAYQLETAATNLVDRFNGTTSSTVDLATGLTVTKGVLEGLPVDAFAEVPNLRPGVYALTYTFPDYVDSTDQQQTLSFTRPLIVLSHRGDVDSDLTLDANDASDIHNRYSFPLPIGPNGDSANYPAGDKLVYRYRIVDANNDRNINNVDANLISRILRTGEALPQFYLPTDYTNHITTP